MKVLVRLPNWLGDLVMSLGVLQQLPVFFPEAEVSVIVKKGIHELLPFFPPLRHSFVFHKPDYKGPRGAVRFGRMIRRTERFDLFISLPDSFSSALIGAASGACQRIGYKNDLRQLLLTHAYSKPVGLHRVEEYIRLLTLFTGKAAADTTIRLRHSFPRKDYVAVNINSEASSRRLTVNKAVELLSTLRRQTDRGIVLIGAPKEKDFVDAVIASLPDKRAIENRAGTTSLTGLVELLASARALLTTDSGPAHLANALGTPTVVLFGAGNEANTAPFNKELCSVIRLGQLSCEPCLKNVCVRYATPQCLEQLNTALIMDTLNPFAA